MSPRHRQRAWRTLILALGAAICGGASAQAEFSPANFGDDEKSLRNLIEFPELRGDTAVTVSCIGVLKSRGKFDQHYCYQRNPGDETFVRQIYRVIKKARLKPATYNGRGVEVVFQYQVRFEQKGEEQRLDFAANPGLGENVEAYGIRHVAAQRLMRKEQWQKSCPQQTQFVVLARANVNWEGTPSAVSITHMDGIPITQKCEQAITQAVLDSRFIPTFADGEPVPSTYVEPFGN